MTEEEFYKKEQELLTKLVEFEKLPPTKESRELQGAVKRQIAYLNKYYKKAKNP